MKPLRVIEKKPAPLALATLSKQANEAYRKSRESCTDAIQQTITCGKALLEAKKQLPHGAFLKWLKGHFDGSSKQAERYMKVASNSTRVSNFPSLRQALAALEEPKPHRQQRDESEPSAHKPVFDDRDSKHWNRVTEALKAACRELAQNDRQAFLSMIKQYIENLEEQYA